MPVLCLAILHCTRQQNIFILSTPITPPPTIPSPNHRYPSIMMAKQNTLYKPRTFWLRWSAVCVFIFCLPLLGMVLSPEEVHWTILDFVAAAALLSVLGICIDQIQRRISTSPLNWLAIAAAVLGIAIVWAELAVGIF